LEPRLVGACGGALSASGPRRLGTLERYPSDRADWQAAAAARIAPQRILWRPPPVQIRYRRGTVLALRPIAGHQVRPRDDGFDVQALIAAYATGYQPDAPLRRFAGGLAGAVDASRGWWPWRELIAASRGAIELLLRR